MGTQDWRGTPIEVGDTVVFPSRMSSSMWMSEGVVTAITEALPLVNWEGKSFPQPPKIAVKSKKTNRTVYPAPDRITVIPR